MKRAKEAADYELKRNRQEKLDEVEIDLRARRRAHEETISQEKQALQLKKEELEEAGNRTETARKQTQEFPDQLEKAVKQAVGTAQSEEQARAKVAKDLLEKQVEGEKSRKSI